MKQAAESKAKARQLAKGKNSIMNGRALFTYNPNLFQDDDNAIDADNYEEQPEMAVGNSKPEEKKEETVVDSSLFTADQAVDEEEPDFD